MKSDSITLPSSVVTARHARRRAALGVVTITVFGRAASKRTRSNTVDRGASRCSITSTTVAASYPARRLSQYSRFPSAPSLLIEGVKAFLRHNPSRAHTLRLWNGAQQPPLPCAVARDGSTPPSSLPLPSAPLPSHLDQDCLSPPAEREPLAPVVAVARLTRSACRCKKGAAQQTSVSAGSLPPMPVQDGACLGAGKMSILIFELAIHKDTRTKLLAIRTP